MGLLPWLAGAQLDVLEQSPQDRPRFTGLGAAILASASVAAVSMAVALRAEVRVSLLIAIAAGIAWGLAVLSLNRFSVVSMGGRLRLTDLRSFCT
jgi:hypothetical protein